MALVVTVVQLVELEAQAVVVVVADRPYWP
jgi:hypothetical protein